MTTRKKPPWFIGLRQPSFPLLPTPQVRSPAVPGSPLSTTPSHLHHPGSPNHQRCLSPPPDGRVNFAGRGPEPDPYEPYSLGETEEEEEDDDEEEGVEEEKEESEDEDEEEGDDDDEEEYVCSGGESDGEEGEDEYMCSSGESDGEAEEDKDEDMEEGEEEEGDFTRASA